MALIVRGLQILPSVISAPIPCCSKMRHCTGQRLPAGKLFWIMHIWRSFHKPSACPDYFIFLAAIVSIFGENFLPSLVIQSVIDSVTCVMIGVLGWYIYSKHWGFFGLLAAIWPNLFIHSGLLLGDTLFIFFFVWFLLSFTSFYINPRFLQLWQLGPRLAGNTGSADNTIYHFADACFAPYYFDYFKNEN